MKRTQHLCLETLPIEKKMNVESLIRDRAFYDGQQNVDEDKKHIQEMEKEARYFLEGIRLQDQDNPSIRQLVDEQLQQ